MGGIVLDLQRMNKILAINPTDMTAEVEAGDADLPPPQDAVARAPRVSHSKRGGLGREKSMYKTFRSQGGFCDLVW